MSVAAAAATGGGGRSAARAPQQPAHNVLWHILANTTHPSSAGSASSPRRRNNITTNTNKPGATMAKATGSGETSPLARRNQRSMEEVHAALARRSSGTLGVDLTRGLSRARSRQGNNAQGLLASSDDSGVLRVRTAMSGGDGGVVRLPDAIACLVVEAVHAAQPTGGQALAMSWTPCCSTCCLGSHCRLCHRSSRSC